MADPQKDTIYIDIDDEITAIINKLQASPAKIVALVLPKRATVLQSIVNMKLLKRAADSAKKNLVLITSEGGLLPLAGAAGVHVAKNLQSAPEIPSPPEVAPPEEELSAEVPEGPAAVDASKSVGELSGAEAAEVAEPKAAKAEETIDVDNDEPAASAAKKGKKKKSKKDKNKIPNFEKFRKRLFIIGGAIILIIVLWVLAVVKLPKAKIIIKTDTTPQAAQVNFVASPAAQTVDADNGIVPAKSAESAKSDTQKTTATGSKNKGTAASGSVSMTAQVCGSFSSPSPVSSGTTVTANGNSYTTQQTVSFTPDTISGGCVNFKSGGTAINAQTPGAGSNTASGTTFAVAGRSDVSAKGSTSGGTDNVVKVVTQQDVDGAKAKLTSNDDAAKEQLKKSLQDTGYTAITETFNLKDAAVTVSPNVGEEASEVTVTSKGTYVMLGVKEDDLKKVIDKSVSDHIDTNKQQIQDYGLSGATYKVNKVEGNGNQALTLSTQVGIGPKIDEAGLKKEIAGKKRGDTENTIKDLPGVKDVEVHYSPFWVIKTPTNAEKITITYEKAN
jgi:hypothetical protein